MIEAVKANFDIPISLDTYKSGVAEAGISGGGSHQRYLGIEIRQSHGRSHCKERPALLSDAQS